MKKPYPPIAPPPPPPTWEELRAVAKAEKAGLLPKTGRVRIWTVATFKPSTP